MPPIFVDTNVPMYAAGRDHFAKGPSGRVISLISAHPDAFVTDAEVFQEIVHRFRSQREWAGRGTSVFAEFWEVMSGRVAPVLPEDALEMARLAVLPGSTQARDLLHAAVMRRLGCTHIVTAGRGFDEVPGIERLDPLDVDRWALEMGLRA